MSREDETSRRLAPLGGRVGTTMVALSPFVAVILFFVVGFQGAWLWSWLFFLLIPVTAIIVYGPLGRGDRR
ncbi:MAG: hypothetical protein J0I70_02915 [Microbacterium sp.]|uniref:hypothetical protein n=1 Tax=Microbacterium sp. TaxID=51671 RepID=UPI00092C9BDB|nr:hypothetical protein [Microbacterium sp.]MBN9173089.1 hypothetical protein [Microbacterium sp.]MBN9190959.1 hypothetical protein [Microbacterium sp.]MBN9193982.1 hypothetical protein [Microbacterium sp.]OJU57113.1 MAG: hypothetical protein BGO04_03785 [Microbacterium sp. 70-38]